MAKARVEWRKAQLALDPDKLVFVDETGTNTRVTRTRGRCRKGTRLVDDAPQGHWKTTTFVAGLRHDAIIASLVIDRSMNVVIFQAWLAQNLAPTLTEGDIVVMDNLPAHKVAGVRDHRKHGYQAVVSAALFARSQSHRDDVRQAQGPAAKSQGKNPR